MDFEPAVLQLLSGADAAGTEAQRGLQRLNHLYFCYFYLVFISLPTSTLHCYCRVEYNSIYALNTSQHVQVSHPAGVSGLNE